MAFEDDAPLRVNEMDGNEEMDVRRVPAYSVPEAAHYLRLPAATLRTWVRGRSYQTAAGSQWAEPLVRAADPKRGLVSFINLVEAHVLSAIRREHAVTLQSVRKALAFLQEHYPSAHPLADHTMETDGRDLFIEKYGSLINISRAGQTAMRAMLDEHLKRIERDERGIAARLFPFTREVVLGTPRLIVIDPRVSFGRPVIAGSGVPTAVVAERYKAGESIRGLARDYGRKASEIEEAIRCELVLDAA